ncbi:MAG: hypothetical protein ACRD0A_17495 [Acidimicrobiales bacterium]
MEELRGGLNPSGDQPSGHSRVLSRGGFGTQGRIEITGDCDKAKFRAELRKFSEKAVRFK